MRCQLFFYMTIRLPKRSQLAALAKSNKRALQNNAESEEVATGGAIDSIEGQSVSKKQKLDAQFLTAEAEGKALNNAEDLEDEFSGGEDEDDGNIRF